MKKVLFLCIVFVGLFSINHSFAKVVAWDYVKDTRPIVKVEPNTERPMLFIALRSDTDVELKRMVFKFVGTGSYTSKQIADNYLYIDTNGNGKVDKKDIEITGGFNFVRPNRLVRINGFKRKILLKKDRPVFLIFSSKFGGELEYGKSYNFILQQLDFKPRSELLNKLLKKARPLLIFK